MHTFNFRNMLAESKLFEKDLLKYTKIKRKIYSQYRMIVLYNFDMHCG